VPARRAELVVSLSQDDPDIEARTTASSRGFHRLRKSDKYTEIGEYTYDMHKSTFDEGHRKARPEKYHDRRAGLGRLVGLRVVSLMPDRFARLVIMNTGLPTDNAPFAFHLWRAFAKYVPNLPIGAIIRAGTSQMGKMPKEVLNAYTRRSRASSTRLGRRRGR